jgi:hypothetical protein
MSVKTAALIAAVVVAAAPLASEARPGPPTAVDACVKSFIDSHLSNHAVREVKKRIPASGPLEAYYSPRKYTIALAAYGAESGRVLAQARCVADKRGVVIVLDSPPEDEYVARADFTVVIR